MKKINLLMIFSLLIISGCSTITQSTNVAGFSASAVTNLEADVSVSEKISGTVSQVLRAAKGRQRDGETKTLKAISNGS